MDRDALQAAPARAAAEAVAEMFPRYPCPHEPRIAAERAFARIEAALESHETYTTRRT